MTNLTALEAAVDAARENVRRFVGMVAANGSMAVPEVCASNLAALIAAATALGEARGIARAREAVESANWHFDRHDYDGDCGKLMWRDDTLAALDRLAEVTP